MSYTDDYKKAKESGETRSLTPTFRKLEEGETLVGQFIGITDHTSRKRGMPDFNSYEFDTDSGPVSLLLSNAFDRNHADKLTPGGVYAITYAGKRKLANGNDFKQFDVEVISEPESDDIPI